MDYSHFLHMLNDEIGLQEQTEKRRILRFANRKEYQQCVNRLTVLLPVLPNLRSVRPLKIINAISCPLGSFAKFKQTESAMLIEEDALVRMHARPHYLSSPTLERKPAPPKHTIPWGVRQIRAPQVWNRSTGSRVKIGVIDTGVDFLHPDLRSSLAYGINLLNRSAAPFDDNGHGTHIAGTIAASNTRNGIVGVAPSASIYPVKAFDHNGTAYISDIILGIDWCVRNRLNIINMSYGMQKRSQSLLEAVRNACRAGIVIVASSGNDGKRASVDFPARYPQTISVGATTANGKVAPFSNKGKYIDVYAPGDKIYSTWVGGKYNELSGTSMATSHVSGLIALMLSVRPGLSPSEIKHILKKSALPLGGAGKTSETGEVDAVRMLNMLSKY